MDKKNGITKKIINEIKNGGLIGTDTHIVLGLSGGPDSLCLFHALVSLSDEMRLTIVPVHVNHKLRSSADAEQEHIEKICEEMGVKCYTAEIDCMTAAKDLKMSLEEAGRELRYEIFSQTAKTIENYGIEKENISIAVAQNADDQSETVLFRIFRGTGIKGVAGIQPVRFDSEGYCVVRPLIDVTRDEIEAYIEENDLTPNIDETNTETDYVRNRIRLELIPYIEKHINTNVKENVCRLADIAAIDNDYMESVADMVYEEAVEFNEEDMALVMHLNLLLDKHIAIIRRVIAIAFVVLGIDQLVGYEIIESVLKIMFSLNPSAHIDLPAGIKAEREYDDIIFRFELSDQENSVNGMISGVKPLVSVMNINEYNKNEVKVFAAFDFDKFTKANGRRIENIEFRTREKGDYFRIKNGKRKTLQNYFVDAKVKKNLRDTIPVVAIGSEILWIPPNPALPTKAEREKGRFSQNYQICDKTETVLFLEIPIALW